MKTKNILFTFVCWVTSMLNAQTFHDAAAFHLKGNVKEATICSSTYYFSEQGELLGGILPNNAEILSPVHSNNFLRSIVIKEPNRFSDGGFHYTKRVFEKYDQYGRLTLAKEYILDRYMKNPRWTDDYYYEYDSYGSLISETNKCKTTEGPFTIVTEYYDIERDSHGNVLKCEQRVLNNRSAGGSFWAEIAYWDEPNPTKLSIYEMISYPLGIKNKSIFTKTTQEVKDLYPNWTFLLSESANSVRNWDYRLTTGKDFGYNLKYHDLIPSFADAQWKRGQRRNILSWNYDFLSDGEYWESRRILTKKIFKELKAIGCKLIKIDDHSPNGVTYELSKGQLYIKLNCYYHNSVQLHIDKYHLPD